MAISMKGILRQHWLTCLGKRMVSRVLILIAFFYSTVVLGESWDTLHAPCKIDVGKELVVVNDNFLGEVVGLHFTWENVRSIYVGATIDRFKTKSPHWENVFNEIAIMRIHNNYFSFYITDEKVMPLCVSIKSGPLALPGGVKIGSDISAVDELIDNNQKGYFDTLVIESLEGGNAVKIHLKENVVDQITFEALYVD